MRKAWVSYGNPEWHITWGMYASLGIYFNLPGWGTGGTSDAFHIDAQAGAEADEGIFMAVMYGATLVHDAGFFNHGYAYDSKYLVFVDELIGRTRLYKRSLTLRRLGTLYQGDRRVARESPETGSYIASQFTRDHFKDNLYIPPIFMTSDKIDSGFPPPWWINSVTKGTGFLTIINRKYRTNVGGRSMITWRLCEFFGNFMLNMQVTPQVPICLMGDGIA